MTPAVAVAGLLLAALGAAVPATLRTIRRDAPEISLRAVLAVTVPAHAALPVVLWAVHRDVGTTAWTVLGLHAAGAGVLAGSFPWWRGRVPELLVVLAADHAATFAVGALLVD